MLCSTTNLTVIFRFVYVPINSKKEIRRTYHRGRRDEKQIVTGQNKCLNTLFRSKDILWKSLKIDKKLKQIN